MYSITGSSRQKKAANLSINKDLLAQAHDIKINLSATLEEALLEKVRKQKRRQWLEEMKLWPRSIL